MYSFRIYSRVIFLCIPLLRDVYGDNRIFSLSLALMALIFILDNRAKRKACRHYAYYLARSATLLLVSITSAISVIFGIRLLLSIAGDC